MMELRGKYLRYTGGLKAGDPGSQKIEPKDIAKGLLFCRTYLVVMRYFLFGAHFILRKSIKGKDLSIISDFVQDLNALFTGRSLLHHVSGEIGQMTKVLLFFYFHVQYHYARCNMLNGTDLPNVPNQPNEV